MPNPSQSIAAVLQTANPNTLPDMLRRTRIDRTVNPIKATITLGAASATVDLTSLQNDGSVVVTTDNSPVDVNEYLPAIRTLRNLRVTASGTANTVGSYAVTDNAGTMVSPTASTVVGLARLSDDGSTLTFPTTITALVITYYGAGDDPTDDANTPSP